MEEPKDIKLNEQLAERFRQLAKPVQDAITSADVEKHLRELADGHKLHVDQWQSLENEVMLALLGFQPVEDLEGNIEKHVGASHEDAVALAADISHIVFEPIRQELERELEGPDAKPVEVSGVEAAGAQEMANEAGAAAQAAAAQEKKPTLTPPTDSQPAKPSVERGAISENYKGGATSAARKDVHNDPYRETP